MMQLIEKHMTPEQLCYWLQGFFELNGETALTKREQIIKDHLKEVFEKRTPEYITKDYSIQAAQQNLENMKIPVQDFRSTSIC